VEIFVCADVSRECMRPLRKNCPATKQGNDSNEPYRVSAQTLPGGFHEGTE